MFHEMKPCLGHVGVRLFRLCFCFCFQESVLGLPRPVENSFAHVFPKTGFSKDQTVHNRSW